MNSKSQFVTSVGVAIVFLGSAATLAWSVVSAASLEDAIVAVPVRGALLNSAAPRRSGEEGAARSSRPELPRLNESGTSLVEVLPDGVHRIDLKVLTFADYDPPELRGQPVEALDVEAFPGAVRSLDGKTIEARGHMIAMDFDGGSVRRFLLTRFPPGCCFGAMPVLDEWIEVTAQEGAEVRFSPYAMVQVRGKLSVGERLDDAGYAESLYRMVGEDIDEVR